MSLRHHARGVSEHPVPALEGRRCRLPPAAQTRGQELGSCRLMIPDGDRRHGTQSCSVEDEIHTLVIANYYVVGVFVLGDDLSDCARLCCLRGG